MTLRKVVTNKSSAYTFRDVVLHSEKIGHFISP